MHFPQLVLFPNAPPGYTGQAGKGVKVNSGETGLEFTPFSSGPAGPPGPPGPSGNVPYSQFD